MEEKEGMPRSHVGRCAKCLKPIAFLKTRFNRWIPVDKETVKGHNGFFDPKKGMIAHFATCPYADQFRKKRK